MAKTSLPASMLSLSSIVYVRFVQLRKYSPNSRCRPSSCLLAVFAMFLSIISPSSSCSSYIWYMFGKVESLDRINTLHGRQIGTQLSGKYVNDSSPRFVPAFKVFLVDKNLKENWTKIWMLIQLCVLYLKDLKDFLDFQCLTVVFLRNFVVSVRFDVLTVHQVPLRLRKTFYFGRNILFKMRTQCLQVTCNLCFALWFTSWTRVKYKSDFCNSFIKLVTYHILHV